MKINNPKIRKVPSLLLMLLAVWLCSCSTDLANSSAGAENDGDEVAQVEVEDISYSPTRAMAMDLKTFSISVFNFKTNKFLAENVYYQITDAGLISSKDWRMATAEMKAIGVSPTFDITENVTLTATDHYFDYTVPTTKQTMLKIGSNMSFTKKSSNNKLQMKFVNALSLVTFKARNELKIEDDKGVEYDTKIYVKSITIHNLISKARFTFTGNYQGKWTPIEGGYANYTQDFPTAVELNSKTFTDVIDSIFVFIPQAPQNNAWTPAGTDNAPITDGISYANADHKVYIELRCAITTEKKNQTVYLWGNEYSYQPIYFPYLKKNCPKGWNTINRQAVYNIKIVKEEALDSDGRPIKPQEQSNEYGEFQNAVFITVSPTDDLDNDNVDDWEDPEIHEVTI